VRNALILEDIAEMQGWHAAILEEVYPGIACRTASSVAEARELIDSQQFDIALFDLGLPDAPGSDAIRYLRLKQERALCIVITIFDDNDHLFPALKAGAQGYLLKDQTREQFIARLRNITAGEPPLSPAISRRLLAHFEQQAAPLPDMMLTNREKEVLLLISKGFTLPKVADMLAITRNTTAGYVKSIYRKLNISTRAEAVMEANRRGLVSWGNTE
jgi:DNA-binding NarL/FixJ family response regulator